MDKINVLNLGLIGATASAVLWMFATFASAAEVREIQLDIAYGQYWDRLDDYDEAVEEGDDDLAKDYKREMERLKAKICKQNPEWERCEPENG